MSRTLFSDLSSGKQGTPEVLEDVQSMLYYWSWAAGRMRYFNATGYHRLPYIPSFIPGPSRYLSSIVELILASGRPVNGEIMHR